MLTAKVKREVAQKIQSILLGLTDPELPKKGEIKFLLHIDGAEFGSWANIKNDSDAHITQDIPKELLRNCSIPATQL